MSLLDKKIWQTTQSTQHDNYKEECIIFLVRQLTHYLGNMGV